MAGKAFVHTFEGGINQDLHPSVVKPNQSLEVVNMRPVPSDTGTMGALETVEGNAPAYTDVIDLGVTYQALSPGTYTVIEGTVETSDSVVIHKYESFDSQAMTTYSGPAKIVNQTKILDDGTMDAGEIVGYGIIRDTLYLFTTENWNDTPEDLTEASRIWECPLDKYGRIISCTTIYNDHWNNNGSRLKFSPYHRIKAIGIQETDSIRKLYWTDNFNPVRYAVVSKPMTENGEPFVQGSNPYFGVDKLEFLPLLAPKQLEVDAIVGGNLYSGMIQYSYQLYRNNGARTAISPATGLYHITKYDDTAADSHGYLGTQVDENTGKGFRLKLDNQNSGYDRMRLIAVQYNRYEEVVNIRVAAEVEVDPEGGEVFVTDVGESLSEYTYEEYSILTNRIFKAEDIATKDARLLAANITEENFKLPDDYDTRSYRFANELSGNHVNARLLNADGSYYRIYAAGADKYHSGDVAQYDGEWEYYNASDVYQSGDGEDLWAIDPHADCINDYNDIDKDYWSVPHRMFMSNNSDVGASGKNIDLKVTTTHMFIDNSDDPHGYAQDGGDELDSYTGYANPWHTANTRQLLPGETYRIGIQFIDSRGRKSFVKWVTDFRMPRRNYTTDGTNYPYSMAYDSSTSGLEAQALRLSYMVKSMPAGAVAYRLMYVPLSSKDRSVLSYGILGPMHYDSDDNVYRPLSFQSGSVHTTEKVDDNLIKFVSPEVLFGNEIEFLNDDRLVFQGNDAWATHAGDTDTDYIMWNKGIKPNHHYTNGSDDEIKISDMKVVRPAVSETTNVAFSGTVFSNYIANVQTDKSRGGTMALLKVEDKAAFRGYAKFMPYATYERNKFGAQYGGNTYEARHNNSYVPLSNISTDLNVWLESNHGDGFITMMEYLNAIWDTSHGCDNAAENNMTELVYFPVDSTLNLDLRSSKTANYYYNKDGISEHSLRLINESAGEHEWVCTTHTVRFSQEDPLYTYNTVYSQVKTPEEYPAEPFDFDNETIFDVRVMYSEKKTNGEKADSWTSFQSNNYIDVDSRYGPVNSLYVFKNRLMYFQSTGFGTIAMNERALIQDNNPGTLALGTGGVFDRYDYMSNEIGNLGKWSIIDTDNALYFFDPNERTVYQFSGQSNPLSKVQGLTTWFRKNYDDGDTLLVARDRKHNEVWFTPENGEYTVAYSERTAKFSSFYTFKPTMYIQLNDTEVMSSKDNLILYTHNMEDDINVWSTLKRMRWYDDAQQQPSIKFIVNGDYLYTKVFDNIAFYSMSYRNKDASNPYKYIGDYYDTFDTLRVYNDFQNTDWVTLSPKDNIQRREADWTLAVPRDAVNKDISTKPDIFDPANLDQSQTFKARIRGNYCIVDMKATNPDLSKFVIPYVKVFYRASKR